MLKRLAAVLLVGATYFAAALAWSSPGYAQVVSSRQAVCDPQYPTRCIKPAADGSIAVTGGGGGGGGATASAAALPVVAGTGKPQNIDLFSSTGVIVRDATGANVDWTAAVPVTQSGTWNITNVSGTVSLPTGAATAAKQPALGTAGSSSTDVLSVQGIASGTALNVTGTGTTASPAAGLLSVQGLQADAAVLGATVTNPVPVGGRYNATAPTLTDGARIQTQYNNKGDMKVTLAGSGFGGEVATQVPTADAKSISTAGLQVFTTPYSYNGSTWDRVRGDTVGQAVVPYGINSARWNYAAAASGIVNTTTAVTIKAAAGAGVRNCLTRLDLTAEALGAATEFVIRDGAAGTVIYRTKLGAAGIPQGREITFPAAICGTANTLMEVATLTASVTGAVYVNANGYVGP